MDWDSAPKTQVKQFVVVVQYDSEQTLYSHSIDPQPLHFVQILVTPLSAATKLPLRLRNNLTRMIIADA